MSEEKQEFPFIDSFYVEDIGPEPETDPLIDIPQLPNDIRWAPMDPRIEDTVRLLSPGTWALGSLMICKVLEDGGAIPSDVVCSWNDSGETYFLQRRSIPVKDITAEGDPTAGRMKWESKFHRSIWNLGQDTFCKAKVWVEGMTTEADTIKWVNENIPTIPTPEIIYTWTDVELSRTITLTRRVPGTTLAKAWIGMNTTQKLYVADQIASYSEMLSAWKSEYIETVLNTGYPTRCTEGWSLRERKALPAVTPRLEPRVPREEYEGFVKRRDAHLGIAVSPPSLGEPFVLQHLECTPLAVFVEMPSLDGEMPRISGLFDWAYVAYFPRYKVATNPRQNQMFMVLDDRAPMAGDWDWKWMLSNACVRLGFPLALEYAKAHARVEHKHYVGLPIEALVECKNLVSDDTLEDAESDDSNSILISSLSIDD